jgi:ferredoxin-NADP reductase
MYGTPELALLVGNVFTFLATFPARLRLTFTKREEVGKGMYEYYFATPYPQRHKPGQYYEWTLPHLHPDSRGIRRYFTISSAPIGNEVSFAVKHVDQQSTWKTALANLQPGDAVFAAQLSGDFTLEDPGKPVVWIAGGIGITPFISMIRAAQHANLTLNATLFYCNRTEQDIAFKAEIAHAAQNGLTTVHFLNDAPPQSTFLHEIGYITPELVKTHAPHWQQATFYISGPPSLVESYERMLLHMGLPAHRVITDYFPGLA